MKPIPDDEKKNRRAQHDAEGENFSQFAHSIQRDVIMARNGSGVYSLPAGSTATDGTTVLATTHNTPLADIEADLNLVRPIVAGGTGQATAAAAFGALVRPYILDTVTESAGVPTGGIIERGSDSNGNYVRFADGSLFCTQTVTASSLAIATAHMGGFRSAAQTWTFPSEFIAAPNVFVTSQAGTAFGAYTGAPSTTAVSWVVTSISSQTASDRTVCLIAVGAWFA